MVRRNSFLSRRSALFLTIGALTGVSTWSMGRYKSFSHGYPRVKQRDFAVVDPAPLKQRAASKGLIYGATSGQQLLSSDAEFAARFIQECKIIVPENDLKWDALRPTPDRFDFTKGDWLMKFARTNKMLIRGHTLVWHEAIPSWFEETVNRQNAAQFLTNHIKTVVGRYAGKMHSWDVVNEAIEDNEKPKGLRNTPWLELLGPNYIDLAFRTAAEADPKAMLVYNDNAIDYDTPKAEAKRTAVLKLLERLKSKGTPIHAFGTQAHLFGNETRFNAKKQQKFLSDVASLDLKILITEMDVQDRYLPVDIQVRDRIVAGIYEDYLSAVLDEPAVIAVLTWGLSDRYTWHTDFRPRPDGLPVRPLPLDAQMNRKLAWNAIARAFDQAPKR